MSDRNLDIALRIKADVAAAKAALEGVEQTLSDTGKAAESVNATFGRSSQRFDALFTEMTRMTATLGRVDQRLAGMATAMEAAATASSRLDAGVQSVSAAAAGGQAAQEALTGSVAATAVAFGVEGDAAAAASARIRAMVQASLALQAEQLAAEKETSAAAASSRTAQATEAEIAATQRAAAAFDRSFASVKANVAELDALSAALNRGATSAEEIAAIEAQLDRLMQRGAIAAAEQTAALAALDAMEAKLATHAAGRAAAGTAAAAHGFGSPAAMREYGVLLGELGRGNYLRFEGSLLTLSNRAGLLPRLFSAGGAAIAGTTAALATFAAAANAAAQDTNELNQALAISGHAAGVTAGDVEAMASRITQSYGRIGQARAVLDQLISSGKYSGSTLQAVSQAALDIGQLSGASAEQAAQAAEKYFDGTAEGAARANAQYHFLTVSIYDQIKALQDAGDTQGAMEAAAEAYHAAAKDRITSMKSELTGLAAVWEQVGNEASKAWEVMKTAASLAVGTANDQTRIQDLQARKLASQHGLSSLAGGLAGAFLGNNGQFAAADQAELDRLQQRVAQAEQQAKADGVKSQVQSAGIAAQQSIDKLTDSLKSATLAQRELDKAADDLYKIHQAGGKLPEGINFNGASADKPQGPGWDKLKASIQQRYAPHVAKTRDTSTALASDQKQLQDQLLSLSQTLDGPLSAAWARYDKTMLDAQATAAKALKAGGDQKAIQSQLDAIQAAAAQARDKALASVTRGVQTSYLQATGQTAAAAKLQIESQYSDLLADMQRRGETAGVDLVHRLINVSEAQAQLQALQAAVDRAMNQESQQEQAIQAQQNAGLLTEVDAREKIIALHRQLADQTGALLPQMQQLASTIGNPDVTARVDALRQQMEDLRLSANDLQVALNNGFQSGLGHLADTMINGRSLKGALQNVMRDLESSLLQRPIQVISQRLSKTFADLIEPSQSTASPQALAISSAGQQAGTSMGQSINAAGISSSQAMGQSITAAGNVAAQAMAAALATGSAGRGGRGLSWMGGLFGGGSGSAAAATTGGYFDQLSSGAIKLFASGGHVRGAGTASSDSIAARLSDGEYVIQAAAVQHYGVGVFDQLNQLALPAVPALHAPAPTMPSAPRTHFAEGGLVRGAADEGYGQVIVNNYGSDNVTASPKVDASGLRQLVIDITAGDVAGGGKLGKTIGSTYGLKKQGVRYA